MRSPRTLRRSLAWLLSSVVLAACSSGSDGDRDPVEEDPDGLPRSMVATLTGDLTGRFEKTGDDVMIGFIDQPGPKGLFSLTLVGLAGGNEVDVTSGLVAIEFATGAEAKGPGLLTVTAENGEGERVEYSTLEHTLYYDTTQDGSQSDSIMTLSKAEELPSPVQSLKRYRLVGTFRYAAALAPDPLSTACIDEAFAAAQVGNRYPPYNAELCEAKRIEVQGSFDITQDFWFGAD